MIKSYGIHYFIHYKTQNGLFNLAITQWTRFLCNPSKMQMGFSHELKIILVLQAGKLIPSEGSGLESNMETRLSLLGSQWSHSPSKKKPVVVVEKTSNKRKLLKHESTRSVALYVFWSVEISGQELSFYFMKKFFIYKSATSAILLYISTKFPLLQTVLWA